MADWGRLMTCMVTPFRADFQIDVRQTLRLAEAAASDHSDAVVVGDEAGEGGSLSLEERLRLFGMVREALLHRSIVIANTSGSSTTETVFLTQQAEARGVDGVILERPFGVTLSQEAIYQHFSTVMQAVSLPVMVRTDRSLKGPTVSVETAVRLASLPNLYAVEDSTGDIGYLCELIRQLAPSVRVYAGMDEFSLPYLSVGAYGVVSSSAQLAGGSMRRMMRHYLAGRVRDAQESYIELQELYRMLMAGGLPGMLKEALTSLGFEAGQPRPPMLPPTAAERQMLSRYIRKYRDQGLLVADSLIGLPL